MPKKEYKQSQERRTFSDVNQFQADIKWLLFKKIKSNDGLTYEEARDLGYKYSWALLSHGSNRFSFRNKDGRITEFIHISAFIDNLLFIRKSPYVVLYDGPTRTRYNVEWKDIWKALLDELLYLFPYAREEAIHMSAEAPTREQASAFHFSLDEKL